MKISFRNLTNHIQGTALLVVLSMIMSAPIVHGEAELNPYNDYLLKAEKESGFSGSALVMDRIREADSSRSSDTRSQPPTASA